jgi:hypothetical protein
MREESHLDEMRSAIRGDFERLAERRGEQELMRVADEASPDETVEALAPEVAPEPPRVEPAPEVEVAAASEHGKPEPEPDPGQAEQRRSWLARLFSPP